MRWLIAFVLLIVVAAGVAVLVFEQPVRQSLHLPVATPPAATAAGVDIDPARVTGVELAGGGRTLTLTRDAAGRWTQPGGWAVRDKEVADLLAAVTRVRSRFQPIPLGGDLKPFGLSDADRPYTVTLTDEDPSVNTKPLKRTTSLHIGKAEDGTVYARVGDRPEVFQRSIEVWMKLRQRPMSDAAPVSVDLATPAARAILNAAGITHVYIGAVSTPPRALSDHIDEARLRSDAGFQLVYERDGVSIFALR